MPEGWSQQRPELTNSYPIYELLDPVKGPFCRTIATGSTGLGAAAGYPRSLDEGPVLMVCQKPLALNQTNNFASRTVWTKGYVACHTAAPKAIRTNEYVTERWERQRS